MSAKEIFELIGIISAAIGSLISLLVTLKKLFPALKEIAKNKDFAKIKQIADVAMQTAEHSEKHGVEKEEMVLNIVKNECNLLGIELNEKSLADLILYIKDSVKWFNGMGKKNN